VDCVVPGDPACDATANWRSGCNQSAPVYCSDPVAGYRMSCLEVLRDDGSQYPNIDIVCACKSSVP
jgi:hypothetical protein